MSTWADARAFLLGVLWAPPVLAGLVLLALALVTLAGCGSTRGRSDLSGCRTDMYGVILCPSTARAQTGGA